MVIKYEWEGGDNYNPSRVERSHRFIVPIDFPLRTVQAVLPIGVLGAADGLYIEALTSANISKWSFGVGGAGTVGNNTIELNDGGSPISTLTQNSSGMITEYVTHDILITKRVDVNSMRTGAARFSVAMEWFMGLRPVAGLGEGAAMTIEGMSVAGNVRTTPSTQLSMDLVKNGTTEFTLTHTPGAAGDFDAENVATPVQVDSTDYLHVEINTIPEGLRELNAFLHCRAAILEE